MYDGIKICNSEHGKNLGNLEYADVQRADDIEVILPPECSYDPLYMRIPCC